MSDLEIDYEGSLGDMQTQTRAIKTKRKNTHNTEKSTSEQLIIMVDIEALKDNPYQPRSTYDQSSLQDLAASIEQEGLLQPIGITIKDNIPIIEFGHRRVRACMIIGLKKIKAIVYNSSDNNLRSRALVENIQRDDMSTIDMAFSFHSALESEAFKSITLLAKAIGKSKCYVQAKKLKISN